MIQQIWIIERWKEEIQRRKQILKLLICPYQGYNETQIMVHNIWFRMLSSNVSKAVHLMNNFIFCIRYITQTSILD